MAARAIAAGPEPAVLQRLGVVATSAHWRNTWLLAAGKVGAQRDWMIRDLLQLLSDLDSQSFLTMQLAPSAGLAAALLDDGFARNEPALERQLLRLAVYAVNQPLDPITFEVCWTTRWLMTQRASRVIEADDGWSSGLMSSCATAC